jgi:hypothetical protein
MVAPGFGTDAADLLAMDGVMSADVTASIANDAAKLPAGSAIIVDDFHYAAATVGKDMTDLVERWPAQTAQLVLASRFDAPLRLHWLRMSGELYEFSPTWHLLTAPSGHLHTHVLDQGNGTPPISDHRQGQSPNSPSGSHPPRHSAANEPVAMYIPVVLPTGVHVPRAVPPDAQVMLRR